MGGSATGCGGRSRPGGTVGDEQFLHAVGDHVNMLYNLARRLTTSRAEAEDLVQETFVRALRGWRRKPPDEVRPWLATICLNLARSAHRHRAARPPEILYPYPDRTVVSPADTEAAAVANLLGETVHEAMWQLPAEQREAVTLMDLCGFTAAEVATLTGAPRGTVLSRVHRDHRRLAKLLEEVAPDGA
jgi:RNA polymerase sigma-70 factor (ECF subfamily)